MLLIIIFPYIFFIKFVPLDHLVTEEIPVINHTPDKLPMFKRQYENKVFIGKFVFFFPTV